MSERLERIMESTDGDELRAIVEDAGADEIDRIAAFRRMEDISAMDELLADEVWDSTSGAERLKNTVLQYLAWKQKGREESSGSIEPKAVPQLGAIQVSGGMPSRGRKIRDWRELAASDDSPAIQRLSRLRR